MSTLNDQTHIILYNSCTNFWLWWTQHWSSITHSILLLLVPPMVWIGSGHSLFWFLHNFFYSVLVLCTDIHSKWGCLQPSHVNLTCTFRKFVSFLHPFVCNFFLHVCFMLEVVCNMASLYTGNPHVMLQFLCSVLYKT